MIALSRRIVLLLRKILIKRIYRTHLNQIRFMRAQLFLLLLLFSFETVTATVVKEKGLSDLHKEIMLKSYYMSEKEGRISELKMMFNTIRISDEQRYYVNEQLHNEYNTYITDSAIHYVQENVQIAERLNCTVRKTDSDLNLVSLYLIAGMFIETVDILKGMDTAHFTNEQLVKYYNCYKLLYKFYSSYNAYTQIYVEKSNQYRDSLLAVLDEESSHYQIVHSEKLYDESKYDEAKEILLALVHQSNKHTHEKAMLAYALANIYKDENNRALQKSYLTLSAICDIKNSIKENASMLSLAYMLYEEGDIENAYLFIKSSMEDAMFCNARLRTHEVSQISSIIDTAYQESMAQKESELKIFLILVSLLSLCLLLAVIHVYRQMKRVARIRKELYRANVKLNELNENLHQTNNQLNDVNDKILDMNQDLSEANRIKETYIGHFLDLCSTYIDKLEKYQHTLRKKAADRKLEELYKILKSRDMIDEELKALYENFDNIFLHLYPNFVEEFNSLLLEKERFVLKPSELLNTELRIFALIRLGISDSSKIASFLHYSVNTIYTYRTRVKNKAAVPRDKFESLIVRIGTRALS